MKKALALLLCLCFLLTGALADVTYPIEGNPKLTVWIGLDNGNSQMYLNLGESPVVQRYLEAIGVQVEFIHPSSGSEEAGFTLLMANENEWPDIIIGLDSYYTGGLSAAYEDGVIRDLTPYLEEYAPDYYALINRDPRTHLEFYNADDRCLAFCDFVLEDASYGNAIEVRADWCEEWGIDPATLTTYDALEGYFQKIQENKPRSCPSCSRSPMNRRRTCCCAALA